MSTDEQFVVAVVVVVEVVVVVLVDVVVIAAKIFFEENNYSKNFLCINEKIWSKTGGDIIFGKVEIEDEMF